MTNNNKLNKDIYFIITLLAIFLKFYISKKINDYSEFRLFVDKTVFMANFTLSITCKLFI